MFHVTLNKSEIRRVFVPDDLSCSACYQYTSVVDPRSQSRIFLRVCSGISQFILKEHGKAKTPSVISSMGIF